MIDRRRAARGDGVGLVEEQHGLLLPREPEDRRDVLRRLSHPHRLELGVADDQQPAAQRVRDRFGADGLAGSRRSGEVEGERETCRVPLAEPPAIEDEIVARDLRQRLVERPPRRGGQDDVLKRAARDDRLDRAVRARSRPSKRRFRGNGAKIAIMTPESLVSIGVGLALAAAAGFRVFVPLLALSLAAQSGLGGSCRRRSPGSRRRRRSVALATAMILEIAAYYVPFFDNMLDTLAAPVAVLAGIVASASLSDRSAALAAVLDRHYRRRRHRRPRPRVDVAAAAEELGGDGGLRESRPRHPGAGRIDADRGARAARAGHRADRCGDADRGDGRRGGSTRASCERPRCCSIQYSLTAPASYLRRRRIIGRTLW